MKQDESTWIKSGWDTPMEVTLAPLPHTAGLPSTHKVRGYMWWENAEPEYDGHGALARTLMAAWPSITAQGSGQVPEAGPFAVQPNQHDPHYHKLVAASPITKWFDILVRGKSIFNPGRHAGQTPIEVFNAFPGGGDLRVFLASVQYGSAATAAQKGSPAPLPESVSSNYIQPGDQVSVGYMPSDVVEGEARMPATRVAVQGHTYDVISRDYGASWPRGGGGTAGEPITTATLRREVAGGDR